MIILPDLPDSFTSTVVAALAACRSLTEAQAVCTAAGNKFTATSFSVLVAQAGTGIPTYTDPITWLGIKAGSPTNPTKFFISTLAPRLYGLLDIRVQGMPNPVSIFAYDQLPSAFAPNITVELPNLTTSTRQTIDGVISIPHCGDISSQSKLTITGLSCILITQVQDYKTKGPGGGCGPDYSSGGSNQILNDMSSKVPDAPFPPNIPVINFNPTIYLNGS